MRNDYGSLVEAWKVDLIIDRAKRKGFREDELEDVQQEIVPIILDFKYDPDNKSGATESTVLTAVVDKRLTFILRTQARRLKHEERYRVLHGAIDGNPAPEAVQEPEQEREIGLPADVQEIMDDLPPFEQTVCAALARDKARSNIAEDAGVSRYEVDRTVDRIGETFRSRGLDAWMCKS